LLQRRKKTEAVAFTDEGAPPSVTDRSTVNPLPVKPAPQTSQPTVNVSTTPATSTTSKSASTAAATTSARGQGNMTNFEKVAAREYINAIEKYFQGGELSGAELEDALNAQYLSYQANIIAEHPTLRPWKSDIHLANIVASQ
jgi:hypothetical protein